jgi:hypothetical protein
MPKIELTDEQSLTLRVALCDLIDDIDDFLADTDQKRLDHERSAGQRSVLSDILHLLEIA